MNKANFSWFVKYFYVWSFKKCFIGIIKKTAYPFLDNTFTLSNT